MDSDQFQNKIENNAGSQIFYGCMVYLSIQLKYSK